MTRCLPILNLGFVLGLALGLTACQQGSVGGEPVSICVPEGACGEAMFQGGLRGAEANLEQGGALYQSTCASCHGPGGEGMDKTQRVDFRDPVWHARFQDKAIADTILRGRPPLMPPVPMNESQLRDVIAHLRSLKKGEAPPAPSAPTTAPGY
ncbi:MAG: cytochrome c [Myxococcota bacterium]|nr:cytochrome c [Myxococcota bacterium]